ncbi:MAG: hypothetical protein MJ225_02580 [Bacilli bacterium]|nr:hypothetical protein [Bacilli bacterium]
MKKKLLSLAFVGIAGAAMGIGLTAQPVMNVALGAHAESVDIYGEHNYFSGVKGVWGTNAITDEDGYMRMTSVAGGDNGYFLFDSTEKTGGTYMFSATMRLDADYKGDNIGLGFWNTAQGARIKENVFVGQLVKGQWAEVKIKIDFTDPEIGPVDGIHMWILNGGQDTYLDIKDMKFRTCSAGILGDNIFKDVGFENIDLSKGDFSGWSNQHSGKIGCRDSQVLWTHEGTKGQSDYNQFLRLNYSEAGDVAFADFCSFLNDFNGSWPAGIPAGEYLVELDVRRNDAFGTTDNVGFAFYSPMGRIERDLTAQVNAAPVGEWTTVSFRYPNEGIELTQAYADSVDSFQFWANTNGRIGATLDIDNVELRKISAPVDNRPVFECDLYSFSFIEEEDKDVKFKITDLKGATAISIEDAVGYELEQGEDYDFDLPTGTVIIHKDFLNMYYSDGIHEFTLIGLAPRTFTIEITHVQEDLPDVNDYVLEETVFGGDFMDLEPGYRMKEEQTQYAWGAVQYDDGGVVIEEGDGHALQFKKPEGSTKSYSSSFVIYHPEKIVVDTIVTFAFDYKYTGGATTDGAVDVSWVGSANTSYHLIPLNNSKPEVTKEPAAKYRTWPIKYTELENGYTHVETSLRIDTATTTSTNSIRFLMMYNGNAEQELRVTNVSLKRWNKKLGDLVTTSGSYTKGTLAGLDIVANLTDVGMLDSVAVDSLTGYLTEGVDYTADEDKTSVTVNLKQSYLDGLKVGEHKVYIILTDGSGQYLELEYKLTIVAAPAPAPAKKGCGGSIIATSGVLAVISALGVGLIAIKKRKEDK